MEKRIVSGKFRAKISVKTSAREGFSDSIGKGISKARILDVEEG